MRPLFQRNTKETDGQDVVEYTLLLSFIVIVSAALFLYNGESVAAIWTSTNGTLSTAENAANH